MALFGFGRSARPQAADAQRRQVENWVREAAKLDADDVVKANEIQCPDPACPGFETVILIMRAKQRTQALKITKPIAGVTQPDVVEALAG